MDQYLSRSIKNWASRHQPPEDGREQLLAVAAAPPAVPPVAQQAAAWESLRNRIARRSARPLASHRFSNPFTQSWTWSFHIATTLRMMS